MHNTLDDSVWTVTTYAQKKWYILLLTVLCLAEWSLFLHKPNVFLFPPIQIFSLLRSSNGEIQTDFAKRLFWVSYFWRKLPSFSSFPNFRGTGYLFERRYAVMAGLATCLQVELSRLSLFLRVFVTVIWDRPVQCCYVYHSRSELGGISQHQTHVTRSASLWPSYR